MTRTRGRSTTPAVIASNTWGRRCATSKARESSLSAERLVTRNPAWSSIAAASNTSPHSQVGCRGRAPQLPPRLQVFWLRSGQPSVFELVTRRSGHTETPHERRSWTGLRQGRGPAPSGPTHPGLLTSPYRTYVRPYPTPPIDRKDGFNTPVPENRGPEKESHPRACGAVAVADGISTASPSRRRDNGAW